MVGNKQRQALKSMSPSSPEVHWPSVDAYGEVHVVVELADDVRVLGVGVRGEEPRVGGHAHARQELVHGVRRLERREKRSTFI